MGRVDEEVTRAGPPQAIRTVAPSPLGYMYFRAWYSPSDAGWK